MNCGWYVCKLCKVLDNFELKKWTCIGGTSPLMTTKQIAKRIMSNIHLYREGGYKVQTLFIVNEFNKLLDELPIIIIITSAAKEHVVELMQKISVVK